MFPMLVTSNNAPMGNEEARGLGLDLLDSLHVCHCAVKDAAAQMRMDVSQLRKAMRGEYGHCLPSVNRILDLQLDAFMEFWPRVLYRKAQLAAEAANEDQALRRMA